MRHADQSDTTARDMIRYTPPKSRVWGHSVNRLSASELLEKGERFLRENTQVEGQHQRRSLTVAWTEGTEDSLTDAIDIIRSEIGTQAENFVQPHRRFHQHTWTLGPAELSKVVKWLDRYEALFKHPGASIVANQQVAFRWLPIFRESEAELPPQIFGLNFSRPRFVTMPWIFYNVAHYLRIKSYLAEIGLVSMSDKHVRPKGLLDAASERRGT
jgi:hypothetical protein